MSSATRGRAVISNQKLAIRQTFVIATIAKSCLLCPDSSTNVHEFGLTGIVDNSQCKKHKPQIGRKTQGPHTHSGSRGTQEMFGSDQVRQIPRD